jgi:ribonuclease VapC
VILDSSVIIALALAEPGYEDLLRRMESADVIGIGAPTLVETGIVLAARLEIDPLPLLDRFLHQFQVVQMSFGELQWRQAVEAFRRFGKGRHAAALNFGDCLSYAAAKSVDEPLLFVGDDFSHTDVKPA